MTSVGQVFDDEPPPFDELEPVSVVIGSDQQSPLYQQLIKGIPTTAASAANFPHLWANLSGAGGGGDGGDAYQPLLPSTAASIITQLVNNGSVNNDTAANGFSTSLDTAYFGDVFLQLNVQYRLVHGELSIFICVFGIIANVLNIIVLSRKNMISPTNAILTGMAVSDLVVIATYLPFVLHYFLMSSTVPPEEMYSYGWAVYTLLHAHISVVFHTISIWLTVLLAVWRYITVSSPSSNKSSCSMAQARMAIISTYCVVPLFCIPVFVCFTIHPFHRKEYPNETLYKVDMIDMDSENKQLLEKINFWAFSILLKLIPCSLLTYLSLALVRILIEARKRKERLLGGNHLHHHHNHHHRNNGEINSSNNIGSQSRGQQQQQHRESVVAITSKPAAMATTTVTTTTTSSVYLEIADNSPTEAFDQLSKGSSKESETSGKNRLCLRLGRLLGLKGAVSSTHPPSVLRQCCCSSFAAVVFCCPPAGCLSSCRSAENSNGDIRMKLKGSSSNTNSSREAVSTSGGGGGGSGGANGRHHQRSHRVAAHSSGNSERTTRMLIAVLIMFLICEFPSGILALLSGLLGKLFFHNVYTNCGEIMDMLALINSAVNFVLYCLMSAQFRKTFSQLFCIRWTEEVSSGGGIGGGCTTGNRSQCGGGDGLSRAGGRNTNQYNAGGGGRRVSNRPEATAVTEMVEYTTPVEEHRQLLLKEMATSKSPNGSAIIEQQQPPPVVSGGGRAGDGAGDGVGNTRLPSIGSSTGSSGSLSFADEREHRQQKSRRKEEEEKEKMENTEKTEKAAEMQTAMVVDSIGEDTSLLAATSTAASAPAPSASSFSSPPSAPSPAVTETVSGEWEQQHCQTCHKSTTANSNSSSHSSSIRPVVSTLAGSVAKANSVAEVSQHQHQHQQHVTNGCMSSTASTAIHSSSTTPEHYQHHSSGAVHYNLNLPNTNNNNNNNSNSGNCNISSVVVTQNAATGHKAVHRLVDRPTSLSPTDFSATTTTNGQLNVTTTNV